MDAYCSPIRDAVSRAIRIDSEEPFTEGVPVHCAIFGILCSHLLTGTV
jgi:hypothetical protein